MKDLIAYRDELQRKLDAVNAVIADLGGSTAGTTRRGRPPGRPPNTISAVGRPKGKRKMSAAGRAAIAAAQKARWAKVKADEKAK